MVKDIKYIIKRILIGTGIVILLMLFKGNLAYDVKAYEIHSTDTFGTAQSTLSCNDKRCGVVKNFNNLWTGRGYGLLHWSFAYYPDLNTKPPVITSIRLANWNSQWFNCDYSATALSYNNSSNSDGNIFAYSVTCPVNFTNGGLKLIEVDMNGITNTWSVFYSIGSVATFEKLDDTQQVIDSIKENKKAVEDLNDDINDDSVDNDKASNSINSMKGKVATNGSISQLLTLPITLYQNILNSLNGSCSAFSLGSLFGTNLTMPCINLKNLLGSTLYGIIDVLISGLFILSFRKKMVDIFNHMTSLNDRGNELE